MAGSPPEAGRAVKKGARSGHEIKPGCGGGRQRHWEGEGRAGVRGLPKVSGFSEF